MDIGDVLEALIQKNVRAVKETNHQLPEDCLRHTGRENTWKAK
jgi:hypothetical protein